MLYIRDMKGRTVWSGIAGRSASAFHDISDASSEVTIGPIPRKPCPCVTVTRNIWHLVCPMLPCDLPFHFMPTGACGVWISYALALLGVAYPFCPIWPGYDRDGEVSQGDQRLFYESECSLCSGPAWETIDADQEIRQGKMPA